jgi:hypothetical protein
VSTQKDRPGGAAASGGYTLAVAESRFLDLHAEVDRLYQAPLAEFTAARNALAARIKAAHGADAAAHVKALAKPSISAWTLNQLYWRHQAEFMALLMAGDALRLAQQQRLGGSDVDVAPPTRSRQAAIDALLALGADVLKEAGHQPSPDMRQRLYASLDALAAYGTGALAPRSGRLIEDVPPPGFSAFAGLAAAAGAGAGAGTSAAEATVPSTAAARPAPVTLSVVARRSKEKAEAVVAQAEAGVQSAQDEATRAAEALAQADAAWQAARDRLLEAQKAVGEATAAEQATRAEREERRRDNAKAGLVVRDAEKRLDQARRALDQT